jgi:PIN domain nuclease of toxin-antitoxin system
VATTEALLLDTHAFLWSAVDPERLSRTARRLLRNPAVTLYLSVASLWELSLKHHKGKLESAQAAGRGTIQERNSRVPGTRSVVREFVMSAADTVVDGQMKALSIIPLSISLDHIRQLPRLPYLKDHKDPFDRLIAAQAIVQNIPLLTADAAFTAYPQIAVRW